MRHSPAASTLAARTADPACLPLTVVRLSRTLSPTLADALQLPHAVAPTGARSAGARLADLRPQGPADLYAPRWIKGIGGDKMGVCPVCVEDGEGIEWLKTKVSQYKCMLSSPPSTAVSG